VEVGFVAEGLRCTKVLPVVSHCELPGVKTTKHLLID